MNSNLGDKYLQIEVDDLKKRIAHIEELLLASTNIDLRKIYSPKTERLPDESK